jgi:hypothetical protein
MKKQPNFKKARDYALGRLENELSPKLTYHCLKLTTEEVVPATDRLAREEKISTDERLLLLIGAYFHEMGLSCNGKTMNRSAFSWQSRH